MTLDIEQKLTEILTELSGLSQDDGEIEYRVICNPSPEGEAFYQAGILHELCGECASHSMRERISFDPKGPHLMQCPEPGMKDSLVRTCRVCHKVLRKQMLTFQGLLDCLEDHYCTRYPYSFVTPLYSYIPLWFQTILKSAQYWIQNTKCPEYLAQITEQVAALIERMQKVKEHWATNACSGFLTLEVRRRTKNRLILHVEAAYAGGNQNDDAYCMDVLFVNVLCNILGIDSQVWKYSDSHGPHWEGR